MQAHHEWFDWIFFAIVGIPWVFALVQVLVPDWLEPLISEGSSGFASRDARRDTSSH